MGVNSRDRSCRLRCSLLLKARLQNWHLYFFSGADPDLRTAGDAVAVAVVISAAGIQALLSMVDLSRVDGAVVPTACAKALKGGVRGGAVRTG